MGKQFFFPCELRTHSKLLSQEGRDTKTPYTNSTAVTAQCIAALLYQVCWNAF